MTVENSSAALAEATRYRANFSGHGSAKGAAGYVSDTDDDSYSFLGETGQTAIVNPREEGFKKIRIGAAWHTLQVDQEGFFGKLFKLKKQKGVDLDLGCLYELRDGSRGCVQAFGDFYGAFKKPPYMRLSGDDRTGDDADDDDGEDEVMMVNGQKWSEFKRILIYIYIYGGAANWAQIRPQIQVRVPGEKPMIANPHTFESKLCICAVSGLENVREGIRMTNYTEYFPGHAEMDRAFGFGLEWEDGQK